MKAREGKKDEKINVFDEEGDEEEGMKASVHEKKKKKEKKRARESVNERCTNEYYECVFCSYSLHCQVNKLVGGSEIAWGKY